MKNLQLTSTIHRQQPIVKANFAYDREVIALIKSQKGVRWSQTLQSWYFPKKEFQLKSFYQTMKGKVYVDYSKLKPTPTNTDTNTNKTVSKIQKPNIQLPPSYHEQLGEEVNYRIDEDPDQLGVDIPEVLTVFLEQDADSKAIFNKLTDGKKRSLIYSFVKLKDIDKQVRNIIDFLAKERQKMK